MGDKTGRIHLGRQDLDELQTRKMKGLKRGREERIDVAEDAQLDSENSEGSDVSVEGDEVFDGSGSEEDQDVKQKRQRVD